MLAFCRPMCRPALRPCAVTRSARTGLPGSLHAEARGVVPLPQPRRIDAEGLAASAGARRCIRESRRRAVTRRLPISRSRSRSCVTTATPSCVSIEFPCRRARGKVKPLSPPRRRPSTAAIHPEYLELPAASAAVFPYFLPACVLREGSNAGGRLSVSEQHLAVGVAVPRDACSQSLRNTASSCVARVPAQGSPRSRGLRREVQERLSRPRCDSSCRNRTRAATGSLPNTTWLSCPLPMSAVHRDPLAV